MSTDLEARKDQLLDADAAEEVVGGRSVTRHTSKRTHGHPEIHPTSSAAPTPPGLYMGPDPNYPNPDIDTGDPNA